MRIYFQHGCLLYKNTIKKLFLKVLDKLNVNFYGFSVNIKIVSEDEIKELNKKYRNMNKVTDVLSFPNLDFNKTKNFDPKKLSKEINIDDGLIPLGDIAICKSVAKKQAKEYEHSYKREICFLSLHGYLHLLGFDHVTPEDEEEMLDIEEEILKEENIRRGI